MTCTKGEAHQKKRLLKKTITFKEQLSRFSGGNMIPAKNTLKQNYKQGTFFFYKNCTAKDFALRLQKALRSQQTIITQLQLNNFINPSKPKLQFSEAVQRLSLKCQNGLEKHLHKPFLG